MSEPLDPDHTMLVPNANSAAIRRNIHAPAGVPARLHGNGLNPLVRAANPLLDLIMPLRSMTAHPNVEALRQQLNAAIKTFEADARQAGVDSEAIAAARYALCTFLDEAISATPWGGGGVWASRSLLVTFHNEAFGGEKFFLILQKLTQNVKGNLAVLELMYLCLTLGLEGRYRVIDNGRAQLETLRERLQQLIRTNRGEAEPALSLHWKGITDKRNKLLRLLPLWVIAAVAGGLILALQLGFSYSLNRRSDPVFAGLHRIRAESSPAPTKLVVAVTRPVRVAGFLAPEIQQGLVAVTETADRSVITLRGDGVFASGSADVVRDFEPLLARIGDALKPVPGRVLVIGHTDDQRPGFSSRFPSNWDLSKARAAAVLKLLALRAGPLDRYTLEGRGETEPLVPNDTPANRARNRRVDIIVLTPPVAS